MTAPPNTVLLDLDGTLIDSQPGIVASLHAALRAMGHAPDPDRDLSCFIGPPTSEALATLLRAYGDDRVAEAVTIYRARYAREGILGCALYPGVADAIAALRARGCALYVATSKLRAFAVAILERLGLASLLQGIYGAEPGGALDHKPELLAHVLAREPIAPARAVMVGDRRHDIAGAHANGMRGIGVLWGYGSRAELEAAGADAMVSAPLELPDIIAAVIDQRGA